MRLIDADALRASAMQATETNEVSFNNCFPYWQFSKCIKDAPTIDTAPVARCGECDRRIKSADLTNTVLCGWLHKITMNKDDFCSYGAKMEDKPGN